MQSKTSILMGFGLVSVATAGQVCHTSSVPTTTSPFMQPWGTSSSSTTALPFSHPWGPSSSSTSSSKNTWGISGSSSTTNDNKPTSAPGITWPPTTLITVTSTSSSLKGSESCIAKGASCAVRSEYYDCCGTMECLEETLTCVETRTVESPGGSPSSPPTTSISPPSSKSSSSLTPAGTCIAEGASCAAQTEYYTCCGWLECLEDTLTCVDNGTGETPGGSDSSSTTTILTPKPTVSSPLSPPAGTCIAVGGDCTNRTEDYDCCGLLECLESTMLCTDPNDS